jgi:hypothetical protein
MITANRLGAKWNGTDRWLSDGGARSGNRLTAIAPPTARYRERAGIHQRHPTPLRQPPIKQPPETGMPAICKLNQRTS